MKKTKLLLILFRKTKRKLLSNIKFNKMEKIEIIKKINDCIDGLNGLISDVSISAKKVSRVCKLRRELTELKNEIEKKDEPQNN